MPDGLIPTAEPAGVPNIAIRIRAGTRPGEILRTLAPFAWPSWVTRVEIEDDGAPIGYKLLVRLDEDLRQFCNDIAAVMGVHLTFSDAGVLATETRRPDPSLWTIGDQ